MEVIQEYGGTASTDAEEHSEPNPLPGSCINGTDIRWGMEDGSDGLSGSRMVDRLIMSTRPLVKTV